MQRFTDIHDDFFMSDAVEHANELATMVPQMLERITLLQAVVNDFATRDLEEGDVPDASYGYIPLDLSEFLTAIFALEKVLTVDVDYRHAELRHRPCAFLEIGCGPGRHVHLLSRTDRFAFDKIQGFDISEPMIEMGRARYGLGQDLFVADCLSFDYTGYDVVFFYRPLSDEAAETAFETRLVDTLKSGAMIVGVGALTLDDNRRVIAKDETRSIYKVL